MTRFYGLDEANRHLEEVQPILAALRDQRTELIRLRDEVIAAGGGEPADGDTARPRGEPSARPRGERSAQSRGERTAQTRGERSARPAQDLRLVRLRMQGLIDQMQAGVARLDELDIVLRDIATGLIDFPALVSGRQVWLCWRLGEDEIGWWHELSTGVAGRRRIIDLA